MRKVLLAERALARALFVYEVLEILCLILLNSLRAKWPMEPTLISG